MREPADRRADEVLGEPLAVVEAAIDATAHALREIARRECGLQAQKLAAIAHLVSLVERTARAELARTPRVSGQPADVQVIDGAVTGEVAVVLGISEAQSGMLIDLARRLTTALPDTLEALAQGRLDLTRARAVSDSTRECEYADARAVEARVLADAGGAPWEGPSPRAWRARVERTTIAIAPYAAREQRATAVRERSVRTWPSPDGMGTLRLETRLEDVTMAEGVVAYLARSWPAVDDEGYPLTMDQRRADAVIDLLRRVRDGDGLPEPTHREPDVGVVLHVDTLMNDGPARYDAGEMRGLGGPTVLDPMTAREVAAANLSGGAGLDVLLANAGGELQQVVRIARPPAELTRASLAAAVRAALAHSPALHTDTYRPTAGITRHVHARNPHCTAYDCPRAAQRCDLDHDEPWPRGPTDADNLQPRCPRHHEQKTRRLVRTRLRADGSVLTQMLTGLRVTTRPEPLPGYGPGEGYEA